jgi:hypothetical protein
MLNSALGVLVKHITKKMVMLDTVHPVHLLSIPKKKNKDKINVRKITFFNFDALNARIIRKKNSF